MAHCPDTDERMNIVIAGHVDHGKSTVIGRLLADTDSLPKGKLEQVRQTCRRSSKPFEYAFLLDALKDEQSQGITIDAARVFFKSAKRHYIIIDAPGHIEFLKNMVTGASHAEAAVLVIDAEEGIQENSRRHGYMISMLGIRQLVVLVNKMDLVGYRRDVFEAIAAEYRAFLDSIGLSAEAFVPVSAMEGANVAVRSRTMDWYGGPTVLETLDNFRKEPPPVDKPFRMPVQGVYKFTKAGDKRRIIAGTVEAGRIAPGDDVVFYPSGKRSTVKTLERFNGQPPAAFEAGSAAAFTLEQQIYISRGQLAARADQPAPCVSRRMRVNLFWMGKKPMEPGKDYLLKIGTVKEPVRIETIISTMDASDLSSACRKDKIDYHDVADCILCCQHAVAFDAVETLPATARFVIVDDYEIRGGGIIRQALPDAQEQMRQQVIQRNLKWSSSAISREQRWERYNQKAALILITGKRNVGKKTLARALEQRLFADGKTVYFMGIANVLYGVDADIKKPGDDQRHRPEHLRRLAEVANILLDAGVILVVTAIGLTQQDMEIIQNVVDSDLIETIWLGEDPTDIDFSMKVPDLSNLDETLNRMKVLLQNKGIIFKP
ncbi:MAG TPA: GTP-binding protein [Anaerohalosphaeraceae bacterium]|nr:GTP-binding protein [Anaerohalosphaeraceae bacterium]HPO69129.1 GTP-binding protein [Anaerohalosphaeraceae bacterium]